MSLAVKCAVIVQLPFSFSRGPRAQSPWQSGLQSPPPPWLSNIKYLQHLRFPDRVNNVFHLRSQNLCAAAQFQSCLCKTKSGLLHRSQWNVRQASVRHTLSEEASRNGDSPGGCQCPAAWLRQDSSTQVTAREEKQAAWWAVRKVQSSSKTIPISVSSSSKKHHSPVVGSTALGWCWVLQGQSSPALLWPSQPPHQPHLLQWVDKIPYSSTAQDSSPPSLQLLEFA